MRSSRVSAAPTLATLPPGAGSAPTARAARGSCWRRGPTCDRTRSMATSTRDSAGSTPGRRTPSASRSRASSPRPRRPHRRLHSLRNVVPPAPGQGAIAVQVRWTTAPPRRRWCRSMTRRRDWPWRPNGPSCGPAAAAAGHPSARWPPWRASISASMAGTSARTDAPSRRRRSRVRHGRCRTRGAPGGDPRRTAATGRARPPLDRPRPHHADGGSEPAARAGAGTARRGAGRGPGDRHRTERAGRRAGSGRGNARSVRMGRGDQCQRSQGRRRCRGTDRRRPGCDVLGRDR